jgi:hypothetical protein
MARPTEAFVRTEIGVVVRRERFRIPMGNHAPPATGPLQSEAIGAAVEVTKPSEPSR